MRHLMTSLAAYLACERGVLGVLERPDTQRPDYLCDTLNRTLATRGQRRGTRELYRSPHLSRSRLRRALADVRGQLNNRLIPLESIEYSTAEQKIVMEPQVATERVDFLLTGQITVVGAVGDGAAFADAVQRLITRLRIKKDNFTLVDADLRGLYVNYLGNIGAVPTSTLPLADPDSAATFDFALPFSYHFNSPYTARPFDTHLPPLPVRNRLEVIVNWATDAQSAGSDPGTGAMLSAGTDTYTFSEGPTLQIVQASSPREGIEPQWVPVFESFDVREWSAATPRLAGRFDNDRRFSRLIVRQTYGATDLLEDSIVDLSLRATGQQWFDEVPAGILRDEAEAIYPAFRDWTFAGGAVDTAGPLTGYHILTFLNGGLLGGHVNPVEHTDLQLLLNVATPTAGDGLVRVYQNQLVGVEGFTAQGG